MLETTDCDDVETLLANDVELAESCAAAKGIKESASKCIGSRKPWNWAKFIFLVEPGKIRAARDEAYDETALLFHGPAAPMLHEN